MHVLAQGRGPGLKEVRIPVGPEVSIMNNSHQIHGMLPMPGHNYEENETEKIRSVGPVKAEAGLRQDEYYDVKAS